MLNNVQDLLDKASEESAHAEDVVQVRVRTTSGDLGEITSMQREMIPGIGDVLVLQTDIDPEDCIEG